LFSYDDFLSALRLYNLVYFSNIPLQRSAGSPTRDIRQRRGLDRWRTTIMSDHGGTTDVRVARIGGMLDFETCYRAMSSRDPRFDGRFVVAVTSTGVYCRPVCPSRTPKRPNTRFFVVPAAAEAAGFRACRRCRPESAPESPEWNVRGDLVARALRLITAGVVDEVGIGGLARQLTVSERHLHRQMVAELGVGPQAFALNRRAQIARLLIESQTLSLSDIAFAAGYASVRQFNHGIRAAFGRAPSELRSGSPKVDCTGPLVLRLRYRPPLPAEPLLGWFAERLLTGVEAVDEGEYLRTLRLPRSTGWVSLRIGADEVSVRLHVSDLRDTTAAVQRCRELFDLDADPDMIDEDLGDDPLIGPLVATRPGLRVPGCADGFEFAVRSVLGKQAARRLVHRWGEPVAAEPLTHVFPTPDALAEADLATIGLTTRRADTIRALARAVCQGDLRLDRYADRADTVARLLAIPGIGQWTAGYVAMHALGDPDAFPAGDIGLRGAARRLSGTSSRLDERSRQWRPWRSYAAMHLWASLP
jgi:AraC family transcriptional regulator of adaptative response / DNA-3-methyladenine glycosylase II